MTLVLTGEQSDWMRKTSRLRTFSWMRTKMFSLANSKMSQLPRGISRWPQTLRARAGWALPLKMARSL